MKKKVIGVISYMKTANGAQEALMRLSRQLRHRGHEAEVWFLYAEAWAQAKEPFTRVLIPKAKLSLLEYVRLYFKLMGDLRKEKPDVVIGFLPLGNVFGLLAATCVGVRRRIASQRSPVDTYGKVMRLLDRLCGSTSIYQSIVCVSQGTANSVRDYPASYRSKVSVVHNGVEWSASSLSREAARTRLGLPQGEFLCVAVGRLKHQKNYPFLLDVLARVPGVRVAIAGDGVLKPELERQALALGLGERLIFLGNVDHAEICHLLRAADALVQTSLFEGQSNTILEAMEEGLPILTTDIPEQRETLIDESTGEVAGLLAPSNDLAAWVAAFTRLRDDADLRARLGKSAHALVAQRFTLDRMITGFENLLSAAPK